MLFDLAVGALMLVFGIWGAWTGVGRQLWALAGLLVAFGASQWAGVTYGHLASKQLDLRTYQGPVIVTVVAFLGVYVLLRLVLFVVDKVRGGSDDEPPALDRSLGFALGAAQAFLVGFIALSAVVPAEHELALVGRRLQTNPDDSFMVAGAQRDNAYRLIAPLFDTGPNPTLAAHVSHPPPGPAPAPGGGGVIGAMGATQGTVDVAGPAPSRTPLDRARSVQNVMDAHAPR